MTELTNHEQRVLLYALNQTLANAKAGTLYNSKYGVCFELYGRIKNEVGRNRQAWKLYDHAMLLMGDWPDGTGSCTYPIPSSYKHIDASNQYHSDHNKWGGKQLKYRIALIKWLITQVE